MTFLYKFLVFRSFLLLKFISVSLIGQRTYYGSEIHMKGVFILQRMYDYSHQNSRMYSDTGYYRQADRRQQINTKCCIQPEGEFPECTPVAMAFVPFQMSTEIYDDCKALARGTVFVCLDKPFMGGGCKC